MAEKRDGRKREKNDVVMGMEMVKFMKAQRMAKVNRS